MESLREFLIKLGLDVDVAGFVEGLAFEKLLEKGAEKVIEAFTWLGEKFVEVIEKTADYGEAVDLMAQKTGFSVAGIQALSYAAGQSGSNAEALRVGLVHLARQAEAARGGSTEAAKSFAQLGVSLYDAHGQAKPMDQITLQIADKFQKLGSSSKRTALAMDVFGRSGTDLIPMLSEGGEGLEKFRKEAEDLGLIMSDEAAKAGRDFGDSMKSVHSAVEALEREFAGPLIEALQPVVTSLLEWVKANRVLIGQKVQAFARGLVAVAKSLVETLIGVGKTVLWVADHLKYLAVVGLSLLIAQFVVLNVELGQTLVNFALNTAMVIAYGAISVATAAKAALSWLAAAAPLILTTAIVAALILGLQDLYVFLKGGDSVLGSLGRDWEKFTRRFLEFKPEDSGMVLFFKSLLLPILQLDQIWSRLVSAWENFQPPEWLIRLVPSARTSGQELHDMQTHAIGRRAAANQETADKYTDPIAMRSMIYGGGGASPTATADFAARGKGPVKVMAPQFSMPVTIHAGQGQDAGQIADAVSEKVEQVWDRKMREAAASGGVGVQ